MQVDGESNRRHSTKKTTRRCLPGWLADARLPSSCFLLPVVIPNKAALVSTLDETLGELANLSKVRRLTLSLMRSDSAHYLDLSTTPQTLPVRPLFPTPVFLLLPLALILRSRMTGPARTRRASPPRRTRRRQPSGLIDHLNAPYDFTPRRDGRLYYILGLAVPGGRAEDTGGVRALGDLVHPHTSSGLLLRALRRLFFLSFFFIVFLLSRPDLYYWIPRRLLLSGLSLVLARSRCIPTPSLLGRASPARTQPPPCLACRLASAGSWRRCSRVVKSPHT